jgi:hypothetical protein
LGANNKYRRDAGRKEGDQKITHELIINSICINSSVNEYFA